MTNKIKRILMLGMGTIQRSLIEIMNQKKHKLLKTNEIVCICPEAIPKYIKDIIPNIKHIKKYITEENMNELLSPLMDSGTLCIDLTVDTDSIKLIALARKHSTLYINTSIEEYKKTGFKGDKEKLTLYYQNIELEKSLKKSKSKVSVLESSALNPGAISNLTMQAIEKYVEDNHPEDLDLIKKGLWSDVASKYVTMIHCAEYDNQDTIYKAKKNYLYNDWSPAGYISEALSPAFISSPVPVGEGFKKSKYNKRIWVNVNKHSMDCTTDSYVITPDNKVKKIKGRMITHNEVISMSDLFSKGDYTPIISYVYSSCPISQESLEIMKKNNYKEPKNLVAIYQEAVTNKDSYDSMGACVFFKDSKVYWCGSVLTNIQTMKKLGKDCKSTCTQMQVSIAVMAFIEYLTKHQREGVMTSEDVPYKEIIKYCKPYWGKYVCKEITNKIKS